MITREQYDFISKRVKEMLSVAGLPLTPEEAERIEVAAFGFGDISRLGLQLITYVNTERVCAKELIMFAHQTCPEHYHPQINGAPGKEETFRCRWGEVYLYVPGDSSGVPATSIPESYEPYFTALREIRLGPGEQYTLAPDTTHWFQAGDRGAIISEFSTHSRDEYDVFTDPRVRRAPQIEP